MTHGAMPEPKYIKPIITRVKLNPEQAVLAVCEQDGAYFNTADTRCGINGTGSNCAVAARLGVRPRGVAWNDNIHPS